MGSPDILALVHDCFRFVAGFSDLITKSSMHIFPSALSLAPKTSIVRKLYGQESHPFVSIVQGIPNFWDSSVASATRRLPIEAVAWSPCGQRIAVAWADSIVEILDSLTLELLHPVRSPPGKRILAFSPDSRLLSCCSHSAGTPKNFLTIWDARTGNVIRTRSYGVRGGGSPSSIAYSAEGKMIGVSYVDRSAPGKFVIDVYDVGSDDLAYSRSLGGLFVKIWTHDQSFRFATAEPGIITVYEIELAPNSRIKPVETLYVLIDFNPSRPFSFIPAPCRLAYVAGDGVILVSDIRNRRRLLVTEAAGFHESMMSFSPDGSFLACGTAGPDIYLWKMSPTGYTPHQRFASSALSPVPLFSPDKTSVVTWDSSTIQLWPLDDPTPPTPHDPSRVTGRSEKFLFDFSPDGGSAVFARGKSNTVSVLDLELCAEPGTIDVGMKVYNLRVFGNTVVVEGPNRFVTWTLHAPDDDLAAATRDRPKEAPRVTRLQSASISPDLLQFAIRGEAFESTQATGALCIYDMGTMELLAMTRATGDMVWFSQDGSQVWCDSEVGKERGWQVTKEDGSGLVYLNPLPVGSPPEGYPWRSSRGYTVTDDGWTLDLEGKRLLRLPPSWRSYERRTRVWSGPYLALLHETLPEPVILKFRV